MPVYVYACTNCGHRFEQQQSFSDDALTVCPECEGSLRKVFNSVGIVFKGSGFYRTDSRSGSGSTAMSSSDSGTSSKPDSTVTADGAKKSEGTQASGAAKKAESSSNSSSGSGSGSGGTPSKTSGAAGS